MSSTCERRRRIHSVKSENAGSIQIDYLTTEKEHQKQLERARKEQRKAERGELRTEQEQHEESDSAVDTKDIPQQSEQPAAVAAMHNEGVVRAAHSMTHDVSHSEPVMIAYLSLANDE